MAGSPAQLNTTIDRPPEPAIPPASTRYIALMALAQFGVYLAFITPVAISLAIRVDDLAPGHSGYLGFITGAGAAAAVLTGPVLGVFSDRTRTRWGRRRPFVAGGVALGLLALVAMALAPTVALLGVGWVAAQLGWGTALANLVASTADRLSESERGKVAGLTGVATQIAPVLGVTLSRFVVDEPALLFLTPGAIGAMLVLAFVVFVDEADSRGLPRDRLHGKELFGKFVFHPGQHPDFSWNWLGRFLFYFGLTLNTTFLPFFFAARLGVDVKEVAGVIAGVSAGSVAMVTAGALGGGFLSDRLRRRRVFVVAGGAIMAAGIALMALATLVPLMFLGSLVSSLGMGLFSAVDQALLLDVLPERDTDAGRFLAISGFATSIPQAIAPMIAPAILAVGAGANYPLLFVLAAVLVLLGSALVLPITSAR